MRQITPSKKRELDNKLVKAYDYINRGDYSSALELLNYILDYLDVPEIYLTKSVVLMRLGRYREALNTLDLAESYADQFGSTMFSRDNLWENRGSAYLNLGDVNKARDCFNIALRYNPNSAFAKEGLKMCK